MRFQKSWGEEKLYDYSQVKEKVIYRLVNYKSNEKMLRNVPYIVYLDLAIVFCVLLEVTKYGTATMAIRNDHLDLWGVEKGGALQAGFGKYKQIPAGRLQLYERCNRGAYRRIGSPYIF